MENNNNNRDFEQFVKQNADQYRMFPSENVWQGIHKTLHTRRRWHGLGFGLLLLTTGAAVTWVMLSSSGKNEKISNPQPVAVQNNLVALDKKIEKPEALISPGFALKTNIPAIAPAQLQQDPVALNQNEMPFYVADEIPVKQDEIRSDLISRPEDLPAAILVQNEKKPVDMVTPVMKNEEVVQTPMNIRITDQVTDNDFIDDNNRNDMVAVTAITSSENKDLQPLGIESVLNTYKAKRKRLSWQVYLVPTISYRKLTENTGFLRSAQSNNRPYSYAALHDINSAVTHKPDMGLEFGFNAGYPVGKNITIIAGLQFNVSKYDIRAYNYPSEVATIALSNGYGNSVSMVSNYRNFGGYSSNWLHNLYISVSAPIGMELKLMGTNKRYLGISSTLQPTYVISDRAYMISTDYKNYVKIPSLIRTWNMNTSFEAFAGYNTGKLKWKVGPQVRYQMLSSFVEKYPVREHLFDFGLKVGIMLNK
jgi:hypothetical protein